MQIKNLFDARPKKNLVRENVVYFLFVTFCSLLFVFSGCATKPKTSDLVFETVWPQPPEKPRIKWLRNWYHVFDLTRQSKLMDFMLGEQSTLQLDRPSDVVTDSKGNVYAVDQMLRVIFVFDIEKKKLRLLGEGLLSAPIGLAIDNKNGRLFVSDTKAAQVLVLDVNSGNVLMTIGAPRVEFSNPTGMAYDEERGKLYISDSKHHVVKVFNSEGLPVSTIGKKGNGNGEFYYPSFLALDREGKLYVVDSFNFRVQIFDVNGAFVNKFGKLGDALGNLSKPTGIAVDSENHIYVVDSSFNNFQIFDPSGRLLLFVGTAGRKPGQFSMPLGMYIDKNDRLYVADTFNHRIQVFQYLKENK